MSKRKISILPVFLLAIILAVFPFPSYAEESKIYVQALTSDVKPDEKDSFVVTYRKEGAKEESSFTIDAGEAAKDLIEVAIPEGDYQITGIAYQGGRQEVIKSGYGITGDFHSEAKNPSVVYLAVGASACDALEKEHTNTLIMDSEHDQNGKRIYDIASEDAERASLAESRAASEKQEETKTESETTAGESKAETGDISDETAAGETAGNPDSNPEEPVISYYEETPPQEESPVPRPVARLVPLCVIFLAALGILFLLHKKGKF